MPNFRVGGLLLLPSLLLAAGGHIGQPAASSGTSVDLLSESKPVGTKGASKLEYTALANNDTLLLADISGSGYIENIFVACKYLTDIVIYIDDLQTPVINMPITTFMAAVYIDSQPSYASKWFSGNGNFTGIGIQSFIPIPFSSFAQVYIVNKSGSGATIWSHVTYNTGLPNTWPRTRKLRTAYGSRSNVAPYEVLTMADLTGLSKGRILGIYWMYDGFPGSVSFKQGPLEGNFAVFTNGGASPVFEAPGSEDFFGMSGYFTNFDARAGGGDYLLTIKTSVTWAGYRMFIKDPIGFDNGFKVTWENGKSGQPDANAFTGNSTVIWCVWYYTE